MIESTSEEYGWPCQRLRLGIGALLFTLFEVTIGRQLPGILVAMILGLGVGCLVSAMAALQDVRLRMQLEVIREALEGRSSAPRA